MYRNIGYTTIPAERFLPEFASALAAKFGARFDTVISEAVGKLGRDATKLKDLIPEMIVALETTAFMAGTEEHRQLLHIIFRSLNYMGYMSQEIPVYQLIHDPRLPFDELVALIAGDCMWKPTARDVGGEYATIANFRAVLPMFIRQYAFANWEKRKVKLALRRFIGDIGFRIKQNGVPTQMERSMLVNYGSTALGSPGHSASDLEGQPEIIAPLENRDPIDAEFVGRISKVSLEGPWYNHVTMLSDQNMHALTVLLGIIPTELSVYSGIRETLGPFVRPEMEVVESIKWSPALQMAGLIDHSDYVTLPTANTGEIVVHPPRIVRDAVVRNTGFGPVPDSPDMTYFLRSDSDVSKLIWQFDSPFRRTIVSNLHTHSSLADYVLDVGLKKSEFGNSAVPINNLAKTPFADMTHASLQGTFMPLSNTQLEETIYLPRTGSRKLEARTVDVTELYSRLGEITTTSCFGRSWFAPRAWFSTPDDQAWHFISNRLALTPEESKRFKSIITIAHNAEKFSRVAQTPVPFDVKGYCAAVGGYSV